MQRIFIRFEYFYQYLLINNFAETLCDEHRHVDDENISWTYLWNIKRIVIVILFKIIQNHVHLT